MSWCSIEEEGARVIAAGKSLFYVLLDITLAQALPTDHWISYELSIKPVDADWTGTAEWAPELTYTGYALPGFVIASEARSLLHGSCRKPHHSSGDGLVVADTLLADIVRGGAVDARLPHWPSMLVMTGDQVYVDDVAGPMLRAIHALLGRLGLANEDLSSLANEEIGGADALYTHAQTYYGRESLLPRNPRPHPLHDILFGGVRKPIFTTANAHNHLITLAEVLAMYLLVWSPAPWRGLDLSAPANLTDKDAELYQRELVVIERFALELNKVRRLFAHVPVAMIFDDHDVTDDWNLNREWEETAYGHPFSRRVIGNALIGYAINQAWGNNPDAFDEPFMGALEATLEKPGTPQHDDHIHDLLRFDGWDFVWPTSPPLIVLDTRTRRWRSESRAYKPSGLLDWEAVTDLQQILRGKDSVMMVSAAPIFGVKLIEFAQKIFTLLGKPLLVDAENWMAHPGTANAILNVFRHPATPSRFVVLSGDVHYAFVYDVELRGRHRGPDIWQICSSGLRNAFPDTLLATLDRLNRWLYAPRSPLNWFTRRRHMRVIPRKPYGSTDPTRRLVNGSSIGLVELRDDGAPWRIRQWMADGAVVTFLRKEDESHWD